MAILVEDGFNYTEIIKVMEAMEDAGITTEIISKNLGMLTSVDGMQLEVNKNYHNAASIMYDAVYISGGRQCVDSLLSQGDALHFINEAFKHAKTIGATNEGVDLIKFSQIQGLTTIASKDQDQMVSDLGVVTIHNTLELDHFNQEFIQGIAKHRHWERQNIKGIVPA